MPELDMLLNVFPHDRTLTHAATLTSGDDDALRSAVTQRFGGRQWRIESWRATPVRYREHLSLVVRHEVTAREAAAGACTRTFYAKGFPTAADAHRVHDLVTELARQTTERGAGVGVDEPCALLPHLDAVLFEATSGRPLDVILDRCDTAPEDAVRAAARAVARFNLSAIEVPRYYTRADYRAWLRRPYDLLEWVCPDLERELRAAPAALARLPEPAEFCPAHRDMKPEHVILSDDQAALIDLDSCAMADPGTDLALMLARFAGRATVDGWAESMQGHAVLFASEYASLVPRRWLEHLPVLVGCSLIEVAAGVFHRQEHAWNERVRQLVHLSARVAASSPDDVMNPGGLLVSSQLDWLSRPR